MKLTNKLNLPDALYKAIIDDDYDRGDSDYTATQLIQPIQMTLLKEKYKEEIIEDVQDLLYRLYGKIAHGICEKAAGDNEIVEVRYYSTFAGKKISAQIDNLTLIKDVLSDYKFTTYYGFRLPLKPKQEWVIQLNIQLELLRRNGLDAKILQIVGLLRDFNLNKSRTEKNYPPVPVMTMPIPMMDRDLISSWIEARVGEIENHKIHGTVPTCSDEDRWWNFKMKEFGRCANYCSVSKFCNQNTGGF